MMFSYGSRDGNLWKALSDIFNLNLVYENTQYAIKQRNDFLTSPSNAANRFIRSNAYYKKQKKFNPSYTTFDFRKEQYALVFNNT